MYVTDRDGIFCGDSLMLVFRDILLVFGFCLLGLALLVKGPSDDARYLLILGVLLLLFSCVLWVGHKVGLLLARTESAILKEDTKKGLKEEPKEARYRYDPHTGYNRKVL